MKKVVSIILFVIIVIAINYGYLELMDNYYDNKVKESYCDSIGDENYTNKDQGEILQEISADREDNLMIFGSSELASTLSIPENPVNLFKNKKDGFQVNIIGRGYCQDITHAMDFLAMGNYFKNKKVVFVLSSQWFAASGITPAAFNMNFSELHFYSIMFNKNIDKATKLKVTARVSKLLKETKDYTSDKIYSYLYSRNNIVTNLMVWAITPYYKYEYKLLTIKDKMNAYQILKRYDNKEKTIKAQNTKIDWGKELKDAESNGEARCTNNDLGIYNEYYDKYVKPNLQKDKNVNAGASYTKSPEYDDLKFLLESAKKLNMKILFISTPVNGAWYDYTGITREARQEYYKKVKNIVTSYGFKIEDYSDSDYEKYFMCDIMHLGWKGWVKIDEAMDKFYHQN